MIGIHRTGTAPPHAIPGTAGLESTEAYTYIKLVISKDILLDLYLLGDIVMIEVQSMSDNRTQLNIKIDARTHWLANLVARYQGLTLAEFVESSIARAITREAMLSDETKGIEPSEPSTLQFETLWSEDEATRLYNVATDPRTHNSLTGSQRNLWALISSAVANEGKKLNLKTFQQHYNLVQGENLKEGSK